METAQVLTLMEEERERFDAALARLSRERLLAPEAYGSEIGEGAEAGDGWSAKDIVAHITWFEREMIGVIRQRALVGSELWSLAQDERNAAIYAQQRDLPLDETLAEAQTVYAALRAEIATLSDAEMNDPALIAEMPGGWALWQLLAGNTWEHYAEHTPALQALANTSAAEG